MRIAVFGAGAVGGHFAARLAKGGAEVSVVVRGPTLAAIRARGLRAETTEGVIEARVRASDDPAELGRQDAVIVTAKAHHLPGVAAGIGPLLGPGTPVVFALNGIPWWYFDRHGGPWDGHPLPRLDPGGAVRRAVGVGRTIGGVIYSACTIVEPGVIRVANAGGQLILGEPDGTISDRARRVAAALEAGGLAAPVVPDIRREVWRKLVSNLTNGPLALVTRQDLATTIGDPVLGPRQSVALGEAAAIAAGLGQDLGPEAVEAARGNRGLRHRPSILQDLDAGKRLELDAMAVVPLELARLAGVATPILDEWVAMARLSARFHGVYDGA